MKIVLVTLAACLLVGCAMYKSIPTEGMKFERVIELNNAEKNVIFIKSMSWMVESFGSSKAVIEYQDKDEGVIIGKAFYEQSEITLWGQYIINIWFQIRIDVKDEKVKILFSDLQSETTGNNYAGAKRAVIAENYLDAVANRFERSMDAFGQFVSVEQEEW